LRTEQNKTTFLLAKVNKKGESLKGFNLNNPGFQPGDRKASKTTVREEAGIEKQQWLRTERV
jgi:hypothetical protein